MITQFAGLPTAGIRAFSATDGYRLHFRYWRPQGTLVGRIVALHGIQSHSGWYAYSSARLCAAGWEVWFLDRRGSGMNEPQRGHASGPERLLSDVAELLELAAGTAEAKLPLVLLSVSWSGKLAAITAARKSDLLSGLALLYPGIKARVRPTGIQNVQLTLADRLGVRHRRVPVPLRDPALFTSDPGIQDQIRHDPLALHEVTVGFLLASRQLDRMAESAPAKIHCPVFLALAGGDRIIDNPATRDYARALQGACEIVEYPDAAHTLEFEPCRDTFIADLLNWLSAR